MVTVAGKRNGFQVNHQKGALPPMHTPALYAKWVAARVRSEAPMLYDAHVWYADISRLPNELLLWIDVVREPTRLLYC
ncbi:hypothetical protein KFE25_007180 [Diacronema lutheri]|uniref:Uncharacterized protein n=1 Tax=Diacronema lutheri TaxID=2081491 RepID=A0A8J6CHU8_DIALT|nr:hypothetical protein KFE25_007180 [Diacronema lutheri]